MALECIPAHRAGEEIREAAALLETAGLQPADLEIFHALREAGFSTFIHGSLTSGTLKERSDVDFAIVGDFAEMPASVRYGLLPEADDDLLDLVDYVSTSQLSETGRKMSFHIGKSDFRNAYPDIEKPYAYEYRPAHHAKKKGVSSYIYGGVDKKQNIHLLNVTCPQIEYGGGTINVIPQTGLFHLEGGIARCGMEYPESFGIERVATIGPDGVPTIPPTEDIDEVMLLGLEFDKMRSDKPLFYGDNVGRFVTMPVDRCVEAVGEFIGAAPMDVMEEYQQNISHYLRMAKAR